ncbi:MAG: Major facilitator superfamily 1 (Nitrate/nitrite transporter), partial [Modestobacter sp.]|nr:Major facilitator superfamily 1 (Nitrate/nitrite transporter) [Modestobacter sp.]
GAAVVLVASQVQSLALFLVGFVLLFVLSGIGNGSTYKMIPAVFRIAFYAVCVVVTWAVYLRPGTRMAGI